VRGALSEVRRRRRRHDLAGWVRPDAKRLAPAFVYILYSLDILLGT
jgi:hypothetical protein